MIRFDTFVIDYDTKISLFSRFTPVWFGVMKDHLNLCGCVFNNQYVVMDIGKFINFKSSPPLLCRFQKTLFS